MIALNALQLKQLGPASAAAARCPERIGNTAAKAPTSPPEPISLLSKSCPLTSHAASICARNDPPLYLMGYSAGASAVAVLAKRYGADRILLVAPSGDAGPERITAELGSYEGEVCIVVGEDDEVVTRDAAALFDEISPRAGRKRTVLVPHCDHFFSSDEADRIFRRAPFWAFSDDPVYSELIACY